MTLQLGADETSLTVKAFYPGVSFVNADVTRNEVMTGDPDLARRFVRVMKTSTDDRAAKLDRAVELRNTF